MKYFSRFLLIVLCITFAPTPSQSFPPYQLVFQTDSETETAGSITLRCRDVWTANFLDVNQARFYLNYSSPADPSLRERGDITVVQVGTTGIKFNLTRRLEGYYTCGKREAGSSSVSLSEPKTLICKCVVCLILLNDSLKMLPTLYSTPDYSSSTTFSSNTLHCSIR